MIHRPAVAEPATAVTALHAETGDPLAAQLGLERPGTYDVSARKEGFSPWGRSNVVVPEGECGPETVELTAQLAPGA